MVFVATASLMPEMPTVTVNNITMYYEMHGKGESLLLIGGLSNDVTDYAWMIPVLVYSSEPGKQRYAD